jgi:FkbM family methyltransferase
VNRFFLRFGPPRILVEVGAWSGDDRLIGICRRRGHRLYLFEPNPRMVEVLRAKTADAPTVFVLDRAVSDYDGRATFHIANHDDCSSLQEFAGDANSAWVPQWHPYGSFEMVDHVEVAVTRLDTFMKLHGLDRIDMLEIDAQGEDLRVVQSLGSRIADVRRIQIEVNLHPSPLYARSFTRDDAARFFASRGFDEHVSWTQSMGREANIVYRNRRYVRLPIAARLAASLEQFWVRAHHAALKVPRVLAVTRTVLARALTRKDT